MVISKENHVMNQDSILTEVPSACVVRKVLDKYWTKRHETYGHYIDEVEIFNGILKDKKDNIDRGNILIKVCLLNSLYSTNIRSPKALRDISGEILQKKIDDRLEKGDLTLVGDLVDSIAKVTQKRYYSFVTKYCSLHKPEVYPIYDSIVKDRLNFWNNETHFMNNQKELDLKKYENHVATVNSFRKCFGLQDFEYREVDWYLWITGRELASPKKEGEKRRESASNLMQN